MTTEKKIKISISGSAVLENCCPKIEELSFQIGKRLAEKGVVTLTGATTGIPHLVAQSAYENGGMVLGFSPAKDPKEHKEVFELPFDYHHYIFFTGLGHSGRNLILVRSGDGVIFICGRTGTLNEFIIAFEEKKPMGILVGSGGEEKFMEDIVKEARKDHGKIIWDSDPIKLVDKMIKLIQEDDFYGNNL